MAMIDDRIKKGEGKVYVIQAFCKEVAFGLYEVQILLQLYKSIFVSTLLFNCQSRTRLRKSNDNSITRKRAV